MKLVHADLNWSVGGKPEFDPMEQLYVCLTEATANVDYVLNTVQWKWGNDRVLVTADGLKIEDCAGTQGQY